MTDTWKAKLSPQQLVCGLHFWQHGGVNGLSHSSWCKHNEILDGMEFKKKKYYLMQVEFKQQQKWKLSHARSIVNSNENGLPKLKPQWPKRLKDRLKKKKEKD